MCDHTELVHEAWEYVRPFIPLSRRKQAARAAVRALRYDGVQFGGLYSNLAIDAGLSVLCSQCGDAKYIAADCDCTEDDIAWFRPSCPSEA